MEKEMIYIASPLRGDVEQNIKNAMRYCEQAVREGYIPIAPHTMYRGMWNDEIPAERAAALEVGLALLQKCSRMWVCGDRISAGMQGEIGQATRMGQPIEQKPESYFHPAVSTEKQTFRALRESVAAAMESYRTSPEKIVELLEIKALHSRYSLSNALAIQRQCPEARYAATYHEWHKRGYKIKSLHSIKVWMPMQSATFLRDATPVDTREATAMERDAMVRGELAITQHTAYRMNPIYDITQTDCPVSAYAAVIGSSGQTVDHAALYADMKAFAQKCGFEVHESADPTVAIVKGYYDGEEIYISSRIRDAGKLSALCASLSQGLIEQTSTQPPAVQRFEAGALSFLLQTRMGLSVSEFDRQELTGSFAEAAHDCGMSLEHCFTHISKADGYVGRGLAKELEERGGETTQKEMGLTPQQKQIHQNFINEID